MIYVIECFGGLVVLAALILVAALLVMGPTGPLMLWLLIVMGLAVSSFLLHSKVLAEMSPEERAEYERKARESIAEAAHGRRNPAMVCPHCLQAGSVRTKVLTSQTTYVGRGATAAFLAATLSGLNEVGVATQAYCENCHNQWGF
jgi:uncharacterized membrane protein